MNQFLLIIICILSLIFGIYNNTSSKLTVNKYLITNYMYIFTAFLIYTITNLFLEQDLNNVLRIGSKLMPLFILTILLLFGLVFTPQPNQGLKHLLWLGFIILLSVSGHPIYMKAKEEQILSKVLLLVNGLVLFNLRVELSTDDLSFSNMTYFFSFLDE